MGREEGGRQTGHGGEEEGEEGSAVYSCVALASEPHFPVFK